MNYEQAIEFFLSFPRFGRKGGVHKISMLMSFLGDPQKRLKFVHVAGTNGKGSVCSMLSQTLSESGYLTGLFISPYITDFRERIQINCRPVDKELLTEAAEDVRTAAAKCDLSDDSFCSFEIITAAAFLCFERCGCEIVVLETGVGGMHDCTNVIPPPICSVITSIGFDHTDILGDTLEKIAREKSGIIKRGSETVTAVQPYGAMFEIIRTCYAQKCRINYSSEIRLSSVRHDLTGISFIYDSIPLTLSLLGTFQEENAKLVLKTLEVLKRHDFKVSAEELKLGFKNVKNPARFELLGTNPYVILDGAHNPEGLSALAETVKTYLPGEKIIGLMSMLSDKDVAQGLKVMNGVFETLFLTGVKNNSRSLSSEELLNAAGDNFAEVFSIPDAEIALYKAYGLAVKSGRPLVICGSLYLASQLRSVFLNNISHLPS